MTDVSVSKTDCTRPNHSSAMPHQLLATSMFNQTQTPQDLMSHSAESIQQLLAERFEGCAQGLCKASEQGSINAYTCCLLLSMVLLCLL